MPLAWLVAGAVGLFLLLLIPYALAPFVVLLTLRFRMPATVVVVNPKTHPLPDEVRQYFHKAYLALTRDGFELADTMFLPAVIPNVETLLALYVNRSTSDMAMSTFLLASDGVQTMKANYVEFVTTFSDGVVVQTNNSRELSSFKPLPKEHTTQFWDIDDINRLYRLHGFLAEKHGRTGHPECRLDTQFAGNTMQYMARGVLEKSFTEQVGTGYLTRTPQGFGPTIKGAIIMAWQELWPLKPIRRMQRKRRAEQVLNEFEPFGARAV